MKSACIADGTGFTISAYYDIDEGEITTENQDMKIYSIDIHNIMFEFESGNSFDIMDRIQANDIKKIEQKLFEYFLYSI